MRVKANGLWKRKNEACFQGELCLQNVFLTTRQDVGRT